MMLRFSTRYAAKKLGIGHETLANYVRSGKVPSPETVQQGQRMAHGWTAEDIERVRKLLPKIANGRKTRHKKKRSAVSTQQSVKAKTKTKSKTKKKPQARALHGKPGSSPVSHGSKQSAHGTPGSSTLSRRRSARAKGGTHKP